MTWTLAVSHQILNVVTARSGSHPFGPACFVQLHTGDPGVNGTNNLFSTLRSPAAFFDPVGGTFSPLFSNLPALATSVTHWSAWTSAYGGTFLGSNTTTNTAGHTLAQGDGYGINGFAAPRIGTPAIVPTMSTTMVQAIQALIGSGTTYPYGAPTHLQLHNGEPGANGTANIYADQRPVYNSVLGTLGARTVLPAWTNAPSAGLIQSANGPGDCGFVLQAAHPGGTWHWSMWTALTGGAFLGSGVGAVTISPGTDPNCLLAYSRAGLPRGVEVQIT